MKFDNTNSLKTPNARSNGQKVNRSTKSHVVGVRIDTLSKNSKNKVYYYKTDGAYSRGEVIRIKVPSGGTPKATVAIENSSKKRSRIKELREVR